MGIDFKDARDWKIGVRHDYTGLCERKIIIGLARFDAIVSGNSEKIAALFIRELNEAS